MMIKGWGDWGCAISAEKEVVGVCVFSCVLSHPADEILEVEKPLEKNVLPI